jgi:hypothetical protein
LELIEPCWFACFFLAPARGRVGTGGVEEEVIQHDDGIGPEEYRVKLIAGEEVIRWPGLTSMARAGWGKCSCWRYGHPVSGGRARCL